MFASTAPYIVYLLKIHCYSVSLGKLYKQNVLIVLPSLYLKVRVAVSIRMYILP